MAKLTKNVESPSMNKKRRRSADGDPSTKLTQPTDSPAVTKRPRLTEVDSKITSSTEPIEIAMDPGQKTALLGMIRQRLSDADSRTLYVRKLPRNTTLEQLKTLCPTSINARVQAKKLSNRRKHAFIEFKSRDAAKAAAKGANGKLLADRPIHAQLCSERLATKAGDVENQVTHWLPPHQRQFSEFSLTALYVSCIPRSATQEELRDLFPKANHFDFHMNPKQKGIGSCRITFSSHTDALECFKNVHGTLLRDCPIIVNFAFKKHKARAASSSSSPGTKSKRPKANASSTSSKAAASSKKTPINEPIIVPTYHAPLGGKQGGKNKKSKKPSSSMSVPIPKKLHGKKSGKNKAKSG